ncbi:MAG TPA: hypothetical protein VGC06_31140 [Actinomycetes bacterium]
MLQTALEAEVSVFLGRDRYQRDPDARQGYRNGHQPVTVKTTAGPVTLERPVREAIKGELGTWRTRSLAEWSWSTCTWTPATSRCTPAPAPSRCCAPGASP